MTNVNPNNGTDTKLDTFSSDIFKSEAIFFFTKKY